ncbi:ABC transporter permease [Paenibacillus beijingensis]|uniref:ABC transporter permease n=1 Tax=Paenibacillus beijingensis TaxID=1126833 RepID=A0A0D5NIW7_9BACL|nr:ABC-2 family transporter protein [Paenibacillus beijingensis]AJY75060.1 hypothetical protein VN24_11320 [Paenibacillus beijingensis]
MSAYYYLAKMRVLATLAYRFEVFVSIGTNVMMMLATLFLWKTAFQGVSSSILNEQQMLAFTLISVVLSSMFVCNVANKINQQIREGDIALDLVKPVSLLMCYLAEDIGSSISSLVNKALPMFLMLAVLFRVPLPVSPAAALLFLASVLLSYAILWLLSALVGLTAFWVTELGPLEVVKDAIVRILSGSLIPLWYFPGWVQHVLAFTPFPYTYQSPLGIYVGKIDSLAALQSMGIQAVWILILGLTVHRVWIRAKRSTMVQGG